MTELIFATKNTGKIREVRNIFSDTWFKITSLLDLDAKFEIIEDENTFEGNAKKKVIHVYNIYKLPVIADDSGIEAEQLDGKPGVFSARFAGRNATDEENNKMLLNLLKKFPEPHPVKYICCAVFFDGKNYISETGEIKGAITFNPRGNNGFGYDPIFIPDGYEKTMAELPPEVKDSISHRGQAFGKLKTKINILKEHI